MTQPLLNCSSVKRYEGSLSFWGPVIMYRGIDIGGFSRAVART